MSVEEQVLVAYEGERPRFRGIISECFDAYLGSWVKAEEQTCVDERIEPGKARTGEGARPHSAR